MTSNFTSKSSPPRRRNGNIAACEPCRKAKIKCDHASPICSRCRKRRKPAECVFLPAPMTQPKQSQPTSPKPLSPPSMQLKSPSSRIEICQLNPEAMSESHGFLGSTSFSATIHHEHLSEDSEGPKFRESLVEGYQDGLSDSAHLQLGIKVLRQLPKEKACLALFDWYACNLAAVGFHLPSIRFSLSALWTTFGKYLGDLRKPEDLQAVATVVFGNCSQPLKFTDLDEPKHWRSSFAGENTRWETIGIFFIAFSYALLSLPDEEISLLLRRDPKDRRLIISEMKACAEACIELSRSSLNTLVCHLLYNNMLLETIIHGDASLSAWRLHNDLIGTAVAYGLHCYQGSPNVTIQSEMTKRLSACIFWSDKELSMFTGRPPSLSHRYYSCPIPLDLSDEALAIGGNLLEEEVRKLDGNGWNTQGQIFEATISRMMILSALIQDEIMEVFLGNQAQWSIQRLDDIKARTQEMYSQFPIQLQVSKADLISCPDDRTMWRLLGGRLDHLRVNLLLERLSTERGGASKRDLFEVAKEMLDLTVFLWVQRDRSLKRVHDYDYMIMCYGMPSIGILCTELLKQVKHPSQIEIKLPASEIVQNLSLMISFLDWIRPTAGNYKLCHPLSRVIRRVLDQLFEPAAVEVSQEDDNMQQVDVSDNVWPLDSFDDLEWLNGIDWTLGQYMDLS